jgi:hypothetical protein
MVLYDEVEKLFEALKTAFTKQSFRKFLQCDEKELCLYHFGFGTWIRNTFLQPDSRLYQLFRQEGIYETDEMSDFIIRQFHKKCREK